MTVIDEIWIDHILYQWMSDGSVRQISKYDARRPK